ncbi:MAG: putative CRISPR-associated protein [Thermodesulfobacteriota bacterium]
MSQAMRAIVTTVGTSLLTNYKKTATSAEPPSAERLAVYLELTPPQTASAETNSLTRLELDPARDYLYFFCSDTDEGRLCGQALTTHYEAKGFYLAAPACLEGLTSNHKLFREKGLIALVNRLADLIEQYDRRVVINATGGYKAQIAYATLMGLLYRVEVNYIHEDFSGMVRLPLLPLQFDLAQWAATESQIQAVLNAGSKKEALKLIDHLPEEFQPLFEKSPDGRRYVLSSAGLAVKRAFDYSGRTASPGRIPLHVAKAHSTLWGDHVRQVEDVPALEVRRLLKRVAGQAGLVKALHLGPLESHRSEETHLEFRQKQKGALLYRINTPDGSEQLRIECPEGLEDQLLDRLGVKVYP